MIEAKIRMADGQTTITMEADEAAELFGELGRAGDPAKQTQALYAALDKAQQEIGG